MIKVKRVSFALAVSLLAGGLTSVPAVAGGPLDKARQAVDPDCTAGKAVKGAAMKATVGVGNRCSVAETARDVTGTDGKNRKGDKDGDGGPLRKARN